MPARKTSTIRTNTLIKKKSGFKFRWWMAFVLIIIVAITGLIILRFSHADSGPHYLQNDFGGHNYGAAVMKDATGEHYFWCGINQYVDATGHPQGEEVVYYQHLDYATGLYSKQYPTLQPHIPSRNAGWENNQHMCDPTIVSGNFKYLGTTYKYALYYDSDPDGSSRNTKIGVAFTNNLKGDPDNPTVWKFVNYPIICEYGTKRNTYGVGTASAIIDPNNSSKVKMIFYDTSNELANTPSGKVADLYSVDGNNGYEFGWGPNCQRSAGNSIVNIQADQANGGRTNLNSIIPKVVNTNTVSSPGGDLAYDKENNWYYMVTGDGSTGRNWQKDGIAGGGVNEVFQLIVARIKPEALTDPSKGGWQVLGYINSDTSKSYLNFNPGIVRNGGGYLETGMKDGVRKLDIWNSQLVTPEIVNNPTVANSDSALQTANFNYMKIALIQWNPGRVALNRYVNPQTEHVLTSGVKPKANYKFEGTYYVLPGKIGPLWNPIYSCVTTGAYDYFISTNENCDGFLRLGLVGYSYRGATAPNLSGRWQKLYRCWNTPGPNGSGENFMTVDVNCEGGGKPVDNSYGWVSLDSGNSSFK